MTNSPSVSVIIPTYNSAKFVVGTINSVLSQTLKDIEIIVVDDGSTDNTQSVIEPIREKIQYIRTDNKGPAHARNVGMKAAMGKYVAFLDADDLYLPHKLELEVSFIEAHPEVKIVATEVSSLIGDTVAEEYHLRSYHGIYRRKGWTYEDVFPIHGKFTCKAVSTPIPFYIGDIFRYVLQGPMLMSNTILFPREILQTVGYFNEAYRLADEYELIVRICKHYQAAFLNIPTYLYLYHDNQISMVGSQKNRERKLTQIEIEKAFLETVLDWGYGDKKYYRENKDWLNHRIAELYHCIGGEWLDIGEAKKARECFSKGLHFDTAYIKNRYYWYISFLPHNIKRLLFWAYSRLRYEFSK